ncbi:class I SAM-dependent methyltransferase [Jejudonia soesokkakensis]|uniref:Class I SAM-dependent methyltransferase n=1 Tax=Jejudonia soesokkakensis TaxID=1323432 RepID=A0ABW2MWV6_9FLAO
MKIEVHDTAFMIAYYRAQHEEASKDPYAKLWLEDTNVKSWTDDFASKVSEHDEILHCMRNRFFYEQLLELTKKNPETLFINLGAGFSMYPYVLPQTVTTVEVELPQICTYKSNKIKSFQELDMLPQRNVIHLAGNITAETSHSDLIKSIAPFKKKKTVILIEGVFFFLSSEEIKSVLKFCAQLQDAGELLYCVNFEDRVKNTAVFNRLKTYFSETLSSHGNPFTTLPHRYFKKVNGYTLSAIDSGLQTGKQLGLFSSNFKEETVLNEYFYILKKL